MHKKGWYHGFGTWVPRVGVQIPRLGGHSCFLAEINFDTIFGQDRGGRHLP